MIKAVPFLKGARLSVYANNLFDQRQKVTDRTAPPHQLSALCARSAGAGAGDGVRKMF
jgi:hypothetical protein